MSKKGKIIYFGAAGCGNAYCKNSGVTPDIFVDNDQDKWGTFFNGVEVQNPDILSRINIEKVVITTSYLESVYPQILEMGIDKNLIFIPPKSMWSDKIFEDEETRVHAAKKLYKIMSDFSEKFNHQSCLVAVGGTALGFARESDFIKWDDDIDLFAPLVTRPYFLKMLESWGYTFQEKHESIMNALVFWMPLKNKVVIPVSVDFFDDSAETFIDTFEEYSWEWQTNMFTKCQKIQIHGNYMTLPNPAEKYLEKVYGSEWSNPNPEFGYSDYAGNKKSAT